MKAASLKLGWVGTSTIIFFVLTVIFVLTVVKSTNVLDISFMSIYATFLFFVPTMAWKRGGINGNMFVHTPIAFGWGLFLTAFIFTVITCSLKTEVRTIRADQINSEFFWVMTFFATIFMLVVTKKRS